MQQLAGRTTVGVGRGIVAEILRAKRPCFEFPVALVRRHVGLDAVILAGLEVFAVVIAGIGQYLQGLGFENFLAAFAISWRWPASLRFVGQITGIVSSSQELNEPAPGNRPRVFHLSFPNRTVAAGRTNLLTKRWPQGALTRAAVRTSVQVLPARANVPARGLSLRETGFAPEMTARQRSCRALMSAIAIARVCGADGSILYREHSPKGAAGMTAYLISLALAGLVAIAMWEGFS